MKLSDPHATLLNEKMMTEAKREYNKQYYQKNKEKLKANQRQWNAENRNRLKASNRKRYLKNREQRKESRRQYMLGKPWMSHYHAAKYRCISPGHISYKYYGAKGIRMLMTVYEVELLYKRDQADTMGHPSLDRINPRGDYHFGNCRFIEWSENSRKQHLTNSQ